MQFILKSIPACIALKEACLFSVAILEGHLKALLHPLKGDAHIGRPPDLAAGQGHLSRVVEEPLVSGLVLVGGHGLHDLLPDAVAHTGLQSAQPVFGLERKEAVR